MEALRFEPPVANASPAHLLEDAKVGGYNLKKGDNIIVNIHALHHNSAEWQMPNKFLPERFDSNHPLFLTPQGKKRSTGSYIPFNGGKRVCFGKTFAEANMKIVATYLTQFFDMDYREKDKYPDTHSLPMAHIG